MASCPVCGGDTGPCERFQPEPFSQCERCGFIFRSDGAADAASDTYTSGAYEETHAGYLMDFAGLSRAARVRLDYIAPWASAGRLLDVGTATGAFPFEASQRGFRAEGIEPTPGFARVAGERFNVKVSAVELADYDFDGAPFAAITLWHVLEHLDEPVSQLARLASMLAPDGIIAIEVPNAGGFSARRSGSAWPSLEPAVHINQFAPASLRTALETAGLRPAQIGTVAITPYLRPLDRLRPHHLVFRAQSLRALHTLSSEHPSGYELLRTVATKA